MKTGNSTAFICLILGAALFILAGARFQSSDPTALFLCFLFGGGFLCCSAFIIYSDGKGRAALVVDRLDKNAVCRIISQHQLSDNSILIIAIAPDDKTPLLLKVERLLPNCTHFKVGMDDARTLTPMSLSGVNPSPSTSSVPAAANQAPSPA